MRGFKAICLAGLLAALSPAAGGAWGAAGHEAVALIARDRLAPAARKAVGEILGPDQDLASAATWADAVARDRTETAPWHYLNLDARQIQNPYDLSDACRGHQCVVDQIRRDLEVLRRPLASRKEKREALKFLVHFMGDLHQPLHCADDGDRGGNEKWLRYYGPRGDARYYTWVNLHAFWDNLLQEGDPTDPARLASRLEAEITPGDEARWAAGDASQWALEGYRIAREDIYSELPRGPLPERNRWGRDLPADYYSDKMWGIARRQLEKAGVRLAFLLNGLFGKD